MLHRPSSQYNCGIITFWPSFLTVCQLSYPLVHTIVQGVLKLWMSDSKLMASQISLNKIIIRNYKILLLLKQYSPSITHGKLLPCVTLVEYYFKIYKSKKVTTPKKKRLYLIMYSFTLFIKDNDSFGGEGSKYVSGKYMWMVPYVGSIQDL